MNICAEKMMIYSDGQCLYVLNLYVGILFFTWFEYLIICFGLLETALCREPERCY